MVFQMTGIRGNSVLCLFTETPDVAIRTIERQRFITVKKRNKLNRNLPINTVTDVESTRLYRIAIRALFLYGFDKKKQLSLFLFFFY